MKPKPPQTRNASAAVIAYIKWRIFAGLVYSTSEGGA